MHGRYAESFQKCGDIRNRRVVLWEKWLETGFKGLDQCQETAAEFQVAYGLWRFMAFRFLAYGKML